MASRSGKGRSGSKTHTADEVAENYELNQEGPQPGLELHYDFNNLDLFNTQVKDTSGNGNHVALPLLPVKGETLSPVANFDGVDNKISVTDSTELNGDQTAGTHDFTVEGGVRLPSGDRKSGE